jgi:hypothetical protein
LREVIRKEAAAAGRTEEKCMRMGTKGKENLKAGWKF